MRMNYTPESIKMGRVNTRKAKETPNSFAMQDGASAVQETAPLDRTSQDRMAGGMGARAMQMMNDPIEQQRVAGWMASFGMSNHCLLYTSPSPRDRQKSRMPSSA